MVSLTEDHNCTKEPQVNIRNGMVIKRTQSVKEVLQIVDTIVKLQGLKEQVDTSLSR